MIRGDLAAIVAIAMAYLLSMEAVDAAEALEQKRSGGEENYRPGGLEKNLEGC